MAGGGGGKPSGGGAKKARIEIIPLIDVIFFLLATFVLFTLSLNKIKSVPVQLPVPDTTNSPPDPEMVTLEVTDAGAYYWNKDPISAAELPPRLKSLTATNTNPRVLVAGDGHALFGPTVYALDQIRLAHIEQVSIETRVRDAGK